MVHSAQYEWGNNLNLQTKILQFVLMHVSFLLMQNLFQSTNIKIYTLSHIDANVNQTIIPIFLRPI